MRQKIHSLVYKGRYIPKYILHCSGMERKTLMMFYASLVVDVFPGIQYIYSCITPQSSRSSKRGFRTQKPSAENETIHIFLHSQFIIAKAQIGRARFASKIMASSAFGANGLISQVLVFPAKPFKIQSRPKALVYSLFLGVKWPFSRGRNTM